MATHEDERLGQLLKAIRRRSRATQAEIAAAARVPRRDVIAVEAGRADDVYLGRVRRMFVAAGARLRVTAWWHGAAADRLLDERHAALVERTVAVLSRRGWMTAVEVTFAEWGERGSIDVLAAHRVAGAALVMEVKASLGSLEDTSRTLDVKVRLAPKLVAHRFGWRPAMVSRVLVLPSDSTVRRIIAQHAETMRVLYPVRGREVRAWLHHPRSAIAGIWFVSEVRHTDTNGR